MIRSFMITVAAVCGLCACGSSEEPAATSTGEATGAATDSVAAAPTPTPAQQAAPAGGANLTLDTGFSPDPATATGTSGGSVDASSLNEDCTGWISASPDHVLELRSAMPRLRIMALGTEEGSDTTLVVRRSDGTYLCNDDSDGLHPMVEGAFAQGRHEIFVGSYQEGARQAYRLGVSAQENATPTQALVTP
jgi:hypothetical protein